jgi:hypothetical protein
MKDRLGLIAVIREESHFTQEWLWFHHFAGVERFFLDVKSDDPLAFQTFCEKIKELPFAENICVYENHHLRSNVEAYRFLMDRHKSDVHWMILGDVSEFFFNPEGTDLKEVLKKFEKVECGGVIIPCTQMGLNGFVSRPPLPMTDHILLKQPNQQEPQYKVIVKTSAYTGCDYEWFANVSNPYLFQDCTAFNAYGSVFAAKCIDNKIKCHHYYMRCMQEVVERYKKHNDNTLFDELSLVASWTEANEDATLYSKQLREVLEIPIHEATPNNTVFLSVADYLNPNKHTESFRLSAQYHGVKLTWVSKGKEWEGFVQNKVEKILYYLKEQVKNKKYAFVLDSADVIFVKPLPEILEKFNRIYEGGVLFNSDHVLWPAPDPAQQWHINANYGKNGIVNAGCYCGLISDIIKLLEQILSVRRQIKKKDYRQYCTKVFSASGHCGIENTKQDSSGILLDDDQWLLHLMQYEVNPLIRLDSHKRVFAFVDDPDAAQPRSLYDRNCTGTAGILHLSRVLQKRD